MKKKRTEFFFALMLGWSLNTRAQFCKLLETVGTSVKLATASKQ